MNFDILKNRVKYFKEEGGRDPMCKSVEEYSKRVAAEEAKKAAKKAAKEEKEKTITLLLNNGKSAKWIHDTLNIPLELIEQVRNSLVIKK